MENKSYIFTKVPILIIFITAIIFSCKDSNKKPATSSGLIKNEKLKIEKHEKPAETESIEDKIIAKIFALPEIKERAAYIKKETAGQRNLKIWIAAEPDKTNKYYSVKAGEDNGMSYVTHFDFHVYPKTMEIKYYDVISDSELSLTEWRKTM